MTLRSSFGLFGFILTALFFFASQSAAETVAVRNGQGEQGYGWMFRHAGVCYVVLPRHVSGDDIFLRLTISTSAPVVTATANTIRPFWPGIDLALATTRGPIERRCGGRLEQLDLSRRIAAATNAQLLRLSPTGEEKRAAIGIGDRDYLSFTGSLTEPTKAIARGTSGAFAFVGNVPVGMALEQLGPSSARFMRSEEIHMNVARFLSEQGAAYQPPAETVAPIAPEGLELEFVSSSVPPVNPIHAPELMLEKGIFVFAQARRMVFTFRFRDGGVHRVSRLRMASPTGASYVLPKRILIQLSTEEEGRYRFWERATMSPDGILDTGRRAYRNARYIRVMVLSTWAPGNVAIDNVAVD